MESAKSARAGAGAGAGARAGAGAGANLRSGREGEGEGDARADDLARALTDRRSEHEGDARADDPARALTDLRSGGDARAAKPARADANGRFLDAPVGVIVGIGVDNVNIERFGATLERTPSLYSRLFSVTELAGHLRLEQFAARFAAKEALIKALGGHIEGFAFSDVTVTADEGGAPQLRLTGSVAECAAGLTVHLSLTHEAPLATAFVVAQRT